VTAFSISHGCGRVHSRSAGRRVGGSCRRS
jgi:hypothetical protein